MTIITLHHLFFGHCVTLLVIVFEPQYFSKGAMIPPISHNDLKKDDAKLLLSN